MIYIQVLNHIYSFCPQIKFSGFTTKFSSSVVHISSSGNVKHRVENKNNRRDPHKFVGMFLQSLVRLEDISMLTGGHPSKDAPPKT